MSKIGKKLLESINLSESDGEVNYQERLAKMRDNATYKKMDELCSKHGYQLFRATATTVKSGNKNVEIHIQPAEKDYHSDIYYSKDFGAESGEFQVQSTAYGALNMDEYEKFLRSCQDSYDLIKSLQDIDLETLYDMSTDED